MGECILSYVHLCPSNLARLCSTTTPASSEHADGISSPERRHREALEYAEEDEPDQTIEEEVLEAVAQIPNIPVPRNSDGNVRSS